MCDCAMIAAVDRCRTAPADLRLLQWRPDEGVTLRLRPTTIGRLTIPEGATITVVIHPAPTPDTRPATASDEDGR